MPSTTDTNSQIAQASETSSLFPRPPGVGGEAHNTVYQRMMERVQSEENQVPLVLACVAYSIYKNEKRAWITAWTKQNGQRPTPEQVDYYVSGWNDLSIERTFAAARLEIDNFVEAVVEATKEDLSGEVYQALFRNLSEQITSHSTSSETRTKSIADLIKERTKSHRFVSAIVDVVVSVIANFIWFALTIVILIGVYAQFDFGKFLDRTKGLFSQEQLSQPNEKAKQTNQPGSPSPQ